MLISRDARLSSLSLEVRGRTCLELTRCAPPPNVRLSYVDGITPHLVHSTNGGIIMYCMPLRTYKKLNFISLWQVFFCTFESVADTSPVFC